MADGSISFGLVVASQLANSDTDVYAPSVPSVNVIVELYNSNTIDEDVILYKRIAAGTHYEVFRATLPANGGQAVYRAGDFGSTTKLSGKTTTASKVNVLVSSREYTAPS